MYREGALAWSRLIWQVALRLALSVTCLTIEGAMFDNAIGLKKRYRDGEQILGVSMPLATQKDICSRSGTSP